MTMDSISMSSKTLYGLGMAKQKSHQKIMISNFEMLFLLANC